ncbi:MAG TPA: hypothetical protein VGB20_00595 [bacterium]
MHQPPGGGSGQLIVYFQEPHAIYEAQQSLATMLKTLVSEHGLRLILMEGGEGHLGLAEMRRFGSKEIRYQVAGKYLKLGVISAPEYLDIILDAPLSLWGVEDEAIYNEQAKVFLAADEIRARIAPTLSDAKRAAWALAERVFPAPLIELERAAAAFDQESIALETYAGLLERLAGDAGVGMARYPQVQGLIALAAGSEAFDARAVRTDQERIWSALRLRAGAEAISELSALASNDSQGFFLALAERAQSAGIALAAYPAFESYAELLQAEARMDSRRLYAELDELAGALRTALASTPEARHLSRTMRRLELVDRLSRQQLSPSEFTRYADEDARAGIAGWMTSLSAAWPDPADQARMARALAELPDACRAFERFYELAARRDRLLAERTLAKLAETGAPIAALVTGGYHTNRIVARLAEGGMTVIVVTPDAGDAQDSDRLYRALVHYKHGRGTLNDVKAAALLRTAAVTQEHEPGGLKP